MYVFIYVYTYVYKYVYAYVCIYIYIYMYMRVNKYINTHICIYIYFLNIDIYLQLFIYIRIYKHLCVRVQKHRNRWSIFHCNGELTQKGHAFVGQQQGTASRSQAVWWRVSTWPTGKCITPRSPSCRQARKDPSMAVAEKLMTLRWPPCFWEGMDMGQSPTG